MDGEPRGLWPQTQLELLLAPQIETLYSFACGNSKLPSASQLKQKPSNIWLPSDPDKANAAVDSVPGRKPLNSKPKYPLRLGLPKLPGPTGLYHVLAEAPKCQVDVHPNIFVIHCFLPIYSLGRWPGLQFPTTPFARARAFFCNINFAWPPQHFRIVTRGFRGMLSTFADYVEGKAVSNGQETEREIGV